MGKLREVLEHPDELLPLIQMAFLAKRAKVLPKDESLAFCYDMLNRVSRRCKAPFLCSVMWSGQQIAKATMMRGR